MTERRCSEGADGRTKRPVFLVGRFRSGSTLFWNVFRNMRGVRAYYEPCHDMLLAHIDCQTQPTSSHPGVASYWDEYMPLVDRLRGLHSADFGVRRLYMEAGEEYESLAAYLAFLIEAAAPATPVLKLNRVDFRLPWLKARFPGARIIHVWRNSRDQWYSTVRAEPRDRWGDPMLETTYEILTWSCALAPEFPFLFSPAVRSSYHRHYLLWRMSKAAGERHGDISVAFTNDMLGAPARTIAALAAAAGLEADPEALAKLVVAPKTGGWREFAEESWFESAEAECDALLEELGLLDGIGAIPLGRIRAENEAAWGRFSDGCVREAMDCAMALFSRSRAQAMRNGYESHRQHLALQEAKKRSAAAPATEAPVQ